jgi:hypothetical protein
MLKMLTILLMAAGLWLGSVPWASAAEAAANSIDQDLLPSDLLPDDAVLVSTVQLDGAVLFRVRGVSALPARVRKTWVCARSGFCGLLLGPATFRRSPCVRTVGGGRYH